jgi:hypothetical protein
MYVTGKIYANSMLVLINSRMVLGSEEMPSTIMSVLRFAAAPTKDENFTTEEHNRDPAVNSTEVKTGPSGSSEP